mmetsp:Transcript_91536/g.186320  ORF Transcript_91536/g.186320 Transcript_91536/m.186320 type:complete len:92 (+) Transcript_91536:65-340(+)
MSLNYFNDLAQVEEAGRKKTAPAGWKPNQQEKHAVRDYAGEGGGGGGPSLPFRIKELQILPKALGATPAMGMAHPRNDGTNKCDCALFDPF